MKLFYYSLNSFGFVVYADELPIKNITKPAENLSTKLYAPKMNAPDFDFLPITSEMKFILVDKIIGWDNPKLSL